MKKIILSLISASALNATTCLYYIGADSSGTYHSWQSMNDGIEGSVTQYRGWTISETSLSYTNSPYTAGQFGWMIYAAGQTNAVEFKGPACSVSGSGYMFDGNGQPIASGLWAKNVFRDPGTILGTGLMMNGVIFTGAALTLGVASSGVASFVATTLGILQIGAGLYNIAGALIDNTGFGKESSSLTSTVTTPQGIKVSLTNYESKSVIESKNTSNKTTTIAEIPASTRQLMQDSSKVTVNQSTGSASSSVTQSQLAHTVTTYYESSLTYETRDQDNNLVGNGTFTYDATGGIGTSQSSSGTPAPVSPSTSSTGDTGTGDTGGGTVTPPFTPTEDGGATFAPVGDINDVDGSLLDQAKSQLTEFTSNLTSNFEAATNGFNNTKSLIDGGFNTSSLQINRSTSCQPHFDFLGTRIDIPLNIFYQLYALFYPLVFLVLHILAIKIYIHTVKMGVK